MWIRHESAAHFHNIYNKFLVYAINIVTKHRFSLKHYSYVIEWHGKKLFVSGDTEHPETIGLIKGIDYAFVPTWILFYANEKHLSIDAKTKVIYHVYPNEKIEEKANADFIIFDKQGMQIKIPY